MSVTVHWRNQGHVWRSLISQSPLPLNRSETRSSSILSDPDMREGSSTDTKHRKHGKSWGVEETCILIAVWGESYAKLKGSMDEIRKKYGTPSKLTLKKLCRTRKVDTGEQDADKLKKHIQNLEYEYWQRRAKLCTSGEEGAKKIRASFLFLMKWTTSLVQGGFQPRANVSRIHSLSPGTQ